MTRKTNTKTGPEGTGKTTRMTSIPGLEEFRHKRSAMPPKAPTEVPHQKAIELVLPVIESLLENGYSRADVNAFLKEDAGLDVSEDTLRGYIRKARAAAERATSAQADDAASEAAGSAEDRVSTDAA